MKIQVPGWGKSFLHVNVNCACSNATEPISEDISSFCCSSSWSVHSTWIRLCKTPLISLLPLSICLGWNADPRCTLPVCWGLSHPTLCLVFFPTGGKLRCEEACCAQQFLCLGENLMHRSVADWCCLWLNGAHIPTACCSTEPYPSEKGLGDKLGASPARLTVAVVLGSCCGKDSLRRSYITLSQ